MLRNNQLLCVFVLSAVSLAVAGEAAPAPQTARQALLEMFFAKTAGTFDKHLPEATRTALRQAPNGSPAAMLNAITLLTSQMQTHGAQLQTFEAGSTLAVLENPAEHTKFEILVERDDLRGDEDEIELAFRGYKNGETQTAGVTPRFTFAMKQESGTWRLHEITFAIKLSLTNPDFLKAITTPVKPTVSVSQTQTAGPTDAVWNGMHAGNEASASSALRTLVTAEATYAATYSSRGYTCSLSDLGGMGGAEYDEHHAKLIEPRLASGRKNGYVFAVTGCSGVPVSRFSITATPADAGLGLRAFCSDETGAIRSSSDGNPASCLSAGQPVR